MPKFGLKFKLETLDSNFQKLWLKNRLALTITLLKIFVELLQLKLKMGKGVISKNGIFSTKMGSLKILMVIVSKAAQGR